MKSKHHTLSISMAAIVTVAATSTLQARTAWDGEALTTDYATALNWAGDIIPGDGNTNGALIGNSSDQSVIYNTAVGNLTISSGTIYFNGTTLKANVATDFIVNGATATTNANYRLKTGGLVVDTNITKGLSRITKGLPLSHRQPTAVVTSRTLHCEVGTTTQLVGFDESLTFHCHEVPIPSRFLPKSTSSSDVWVFDRIWCIPDNRCYLRVWRRTPTLRAAIKPNSCR